MDFQLSKGHEDIRKAAREFAEKEFDKDFMIDIEVNHKFPAQLLKKCSELGFVAIDFPEEYGGAGYGLLEKCLILEEFCRVGASVGMTLGSCQFASKIILRSGSEEQKKKYLPEICDGRGLPVAGAFTEPDRGSDIITGPLATTAVKDGSSYVINGTKTFITFADICKYMVVLCQTDPNAKPAYKGHSTIIIENPAQQKGISISNFIKMGWKTSQTTEVSFANVRVPQENLVGKEGSGFYNAIGFLDEFRVEIGGCGVGMAQGCFERALNHAKKREAFGQKIGKFQAISHKLADMYTKIESTRLLVHKAACEFDQKKHIDPKLSSAAKWSAARLAVEVADEAVEILGGSGYMLESEVERFYRDAKMLELVEGTREIHKNTIARSLLGNL